MMECRTYTGVEVPSTERVPTKLTASFICTIEQVNVSGYVCMEGAAKERHGRDGQN